VAEKSSCQFRDRTSSQRRHHRQADDVAGAALVGRHAERGVALEVLDRAEAFARRQRDVRRSDVVLKVDEGFLD
jgi:hypothetical protein